jgi:hypothetical protein
LLGRRGLRFPCWTVGPPRPPLCPPSAASAASLSVCRVGCSVLRLPRPLLGGPGRRVRCARGCSKIFQGCRRERGSPEQEVMGVASGCPESKSDGCCVRVSRARAMGCGVQVPQSKGAPLPFMLLGGRLGFPRPLLGDRARLLRRRVAALHFRSRLPRTRRKCPGRAFAISNAGNFAKSCHRSGDPEHG